MTESSLEGLIAVDAQSSRGNTWIPAGSHVAYLADPYHADGAYPNAIRFSFVPPADGDSWAFYFWADAARQNGSFFRVQTSAQGMVLVQDSRDSVPRYDGRSRIKIGNVVNGNETVVIERYIDTLYGLTQPMFRPSLIESANSPAGSAMFCVMKDGGTYKTALFGPRFYCAFSFESPQFSALPVQLTRDWMSSLETYISSFVACSAIHNLGQHTLSISPGSNSWVLLDEGAGTSLRKPVGAERNAGVMRHFAISANDQFAPSHRDELEIANAGAYANAGDRGIPWAQPGQKITTAKLRIRPIPASFTGPLAVDDVFAKLAANPAQISGSITHGGVTSLGTKITCFPQAQRTEQLLSPDDPEPNPGPPPAGWRSNGYTELPPFSEMDLPAASEQTWAAILDEENRKKLLVDNGSDVLSGPSNTGNPSVPSKLINQKRDLSYESYGLINLTPLASASEVTRTETDFENATSEVVRAGSRVSRRIYPYGVDGLAENILFTSGVRTWTAVQYRRKRKVVSGSGSFFGNNAGAFLSAVQTKAGVSTFPQKWLEFDSGVEQTGSLNLSEAINAADYYLTVPEVPAGVIAQLFQAGSVSFQATCFVYFFYDRINPNREVFFSEFLATVELAVP
jgi:hypothetical protein